MESKGIKKLNKIYKKSFKYSLKKRVDTENNHAIRFEIFIETNIKNREELEDFVKNLKTTDLINKFEQIEISVDFKEFINGGDRRYNTKRFREEFDNEKKEPVRIETYTVIINTQFI